MGYEDLAIKWHNCELARQVSNPNSCVSPTVSMDFLSECGGSAIHRWMDMGAKASPGKNAGGCHPAAEKYRLISNLRPEKHDIRHFQSQQSAR